MNPQGEGVSPQERPPQLTGMDRVLKENLYGNLRYPQNPLAIMAFTLNALISDPEPEKLIEEYLVTELADEKVAHMLERANRAHAAFLQEEERPELTPERMRELWKVERDGAERFFLDIQERTGGFPVNALRLCLGAAVATLKSQDLAPLLEEYRELHRTPKDTRDRARLNLIEQEVTQHVVERMRESVVGQRTEDQEAAEHAIQIFLENLQVLEDS